MEQIVPGLCVCVCVCVRALMFFIYLRHSFCLYMFFLSIFTTVLCGGKVRGYCFPRFRMEKWVQKDT